MSETVTKNTSFLSSTDDDAALAKVRKTVFKYLAHFHYFILFIALALGGAYLYLKYTNPVYKANATLLLVKEEQGVGGNKDMIDAIVSGKPKVNVQDEIELIRSRYMLNKVVSRHKLNTDMWAHGRIRASELSAPYPFTLSGPELSDSVNMKMVSVTFLKNKQFTINENKRVYAANAAFLIDKIPFKIVLNPASPPDENILYDVFIYNERTAASKIAAPLKITPKSNLSRVVELNFTGTNPAKVEYTLQKVMEEYVQLGVDEKRKVQQNTLNFINERLLVVSGELGSVEGQKENTRVRYNAIDVGGQAKQSLEEVAGQSKEISQATVRKQVIDYLVQYLSDQKNLFNLTPTNLGIEDPILLSLSQNYNQLILEREKELTINTNLSPIIKNLDATIEKARFSLLENLKSIRSSNDQAIAKLSAEKGRIQNEISQVPGMERIMGGILRQEKIKNDLFSYLLQKREETEISLAGSVTESKILNGSMVSLTPISPNRRTIWLVALLIGVAIPLLIIWIKDLLNNKINTKSDIVQQLDVPIVGEIGNNTSNEAIVVKQASRKIIGEQFRNIRSNISFLVPDKKQIVILTTSTNAGEGKSFISINLAATYSVAGKKTVLIELDLRKPKLAKYLKTQTQAGFTDYLIGKNTAETVIQPVPGYENFFVMAAGTIPPNPAELLLNEKMQGLVEKLKETYDVIIFDCPPVGLVSDAQIISKYVDLSVYIVRQRFTLKSQLPFINELHNSKRLNNLSIIVNDVKIEGYYGYYGYGSYGYSSYGYGYGLNNNGNQDGYFEEEKKTSWLQKLRG